MSPLLEECIQFVQRLIQKPSMSKEEAAIGALVTEELRRLGYDEVWTDEIGNVYGRIYGRDRDLPALVLNTHLDHVDPGDPDLWPVPPYSGAIVNGYIIGRGAVDIKGPLAVQVHSPAALLRQGERPRRDVVFTSVVQEELGGAGALHWVENVEYPVGLVVLGEPCSNNISLGHRGILQVWVTFPGRSVHASVPEKGDNPNYRLATFLGRLQTMQAELSVHDILGPTTVSPTVIEVDTTSLNVTPAWVRVLLDFRTGTESENSIRRFIGRVAGDMPHEISYAWEEDLLGNADETITGFYTPPESETVQRAKAAITAGMGREPALTSYRFATDGRYFAPYSMPMIGYAPGDEFMAHTAGERIAIRAIEESLRGYIALCQDF